VVEGDSTLRTQSPKIRAYHLVRSPEERGTFPGNCRCIFTLPSPLSIPNQKSLKDSVDIVDNFRL
jgi:hypothetical protein